MSSSIQTITAPMTTASAAEEEHEGGRSRLAGGTADARPVDDRGHEVAGVEPGAMGDRRAHGVGDRQPELHQLDRHRGQQHAPAAR